MKKLTLGFTAIAAQFILTATVNKPLSTPTINLSNQREIIELYRDGQYDVVKAKLTNQGFKLTAKEPDYTIHGSAHEGTFKMEYEEDSPSAAYRNFGWKQTRA